MKTFNLRQMESLLDFDDEFLKRLKDRLRTLSDNSREIGKSNDGIMITGKEGKSEFSVFKKLKVIGDDVVKNGPCNYVPFIIVKPHSFTTTNNIQCGMHLIHLTIQLNLESFGYIIDGEEYNIQSCLDLNCDIGKVKSDLPIALSNARHRYVKTPLDLTPLEITESCDEKIFEYINQLIVDDKYRFIQRATCGSPQSPWRILLNFLSTLGEVNPVFERKIKTYTVTDYIITDSLRVPDVTTKSLIPADGFCEDVNGNKFRSNYLELGRLGALEFTIEDLYLARYRSGNRIYRQTHSGETIVYVMDYDKIRSIVNSFISFPIYTNSSTDLSFKVKEDNDRMVEIKMSNVVVPKHKEKYGTSIDEAIDNVFQHARIDLTDGDMIVPDECTKYVGSRIEYAREVDKEHCFASIILTYEIPKEYLTGRSEITSSNVSAYNYEEDNVYLKTPLRGCRRFIVR